MSTSGAFEGVLYRFEFAGEFSQLFPRRRYHLIFIVLALRNLGPDSANALKCLVPATPVHQRQDRLEVCRIIPLLCSIRALSSCLQVPLQSRQHCILLIPGLLLDRHHSCVQRSRLRRTSEEMAVSTWTPPKISRESV
jgi:hypothetical protein